MAHSVIGVYGHYSQARDAMNELIASGFDPTKLHINPEREPAAQATHSSASGNEHASGIGHFFRALFGMEEHKEREHVYSEAVRRGNCLLRFDADGDAECERAIEVMQRYDPVDIDDRSAYWKNEGWTGFDASAPIMTDEEIRLDRSRYVSRTNAADTAASNPRRGLHVYTLSSQEAAARPLPEEGGRRLFDQQATAHHTHLADASLRQEGDSVIDTSHAATTDESTFDAPAARMEDDTDFRRHWQHAYGQSGGRYEDYDAAYRYGSSLPDGDRFRSNNWTAVEPGIRRDWEMQHPESAWEKVKDAVRYGVQRPRSH